jgi:peptidoglycan/LPS O-acetylase OafA/YrhL
MSDAVNAGTAKGPGAVTAWSAQALPHTSTYRPDIDGLRAVAVGAVVVGHFWPQLLPGGFIGVDVFFVISGFLITQILSRELALGRFTLASFYGRRARRLFPALFTVLAATFVLGWLVLLPTDMQAMLRALMATVFFSANLLFWQQSANYFDATEALSNPLLHLWSLGVEEQFYLVFPWLLVLVFSLSARWHGQPQAWLRGVLWVALLVNLVLAGVVNARNSNAAFYLSPLRAWEFLLGALAALHAAPRWRRAWLGEVLAAASVLTLLGCALLYSAYTPFPAWAALPPVLAAAVLLNGSAGAATAVGRALSQPALVGLGLISYSLYLWHWPVLVLAHHQQAGPVSTAWQLAWLALVLAALTWRFVEQPWRRPAGQRPRGGVVWALVGAMALVLLSAVGLSSHGFEQRLPAQALALDRVRSAAIPWGQCHDLPLSQACRLGPPGPPEVLLWGDSHLLSWVPALDRILLDAGRSAVLNAHFACPALLGVTHTKKRSCSQAALEVQAFLRAHPQVRTVVLAGYWSLYFRPHSPLVAGGPAPAQSLHGLQAAEQGLQTTLDWLLAQGYEVVLLGPVPVYAFNVPQRLAQHAWQGQAMPALKLQDQAERQGAFWRAVQPWRGTPGLRLIDPAPWFCPDDCVLQAQGQSLYRDDQHLSEWGAQWAAAHLKRALGMAAAPLPTGEPDRR